MPKFYYDQIKKPGSLENAVDNFWNNTLPHYFTQDKFYGIELEQRPLEGVVKQRADFTIRYIKNGDPKTVKTVVLMKNKKRGYETQQSERLEAVEQLTNYLKLVRTEQSPSEKTLYAAVTIGTYVRFYYLDLDEDTLRDYQTTRTGDYELRDNEGKIHKILTEYVANTYH